MAYTKYFSISYDNIINLMLIILYYQYYQLRYTEIFCNICHSIFKQHKCIT